MLYDNLNLSIELIKYPRKKRRLPAILNESSEFKLNKKYEISPHRNGN